MRAFLTLNGKFGAGLWLDHRLVARIVATVEDSRVSEDEPEPRWLRDAMVFVDAVNATPAASPEAAVSPGDSLDVERLLRVLEVLWRAGHATIRDKTEARFVAREIAREYERLAAAETP